RQTTPCASWAAELLHQLFDLGVIREQHCQLLRPMACGRRITALNAVLEQSRDKLAVPGMALLSSGQHPHSAFHVTLPMQGNGVHVSVASVFRLQLTRERELLFRFG